MKPVAFWASNSLLVTWRFVGYWASLVFSASDRAWMKVGVQNFLFSAVIFTKYSGSPISEWDKLSAVSWRPSFLSESCKASFKTSSRLQVGRSLTVNRWRSRSSEQLILPPGKISSGSASGSKRELILEDFEQGRNLRKSKFIFSYSFRLLPFSRYISHVFSEESLNWLLVQPWCYWVAPEVNILQQSELCCFNHFVLMEENFIEWISACIWSSLFLINVYRSIKGMTWGKFDTQKFSRATITSREQIHTCGPVHLKVGGILPANIEKMFKMPYSLFECSP